MAYDEYQMQYSFSYIAVLYMNLPGLVDYNFILKRYLAKQVA